MLAYLKKDLVDAYEKHETRIQVGFFVAGFIFDYLTAGEADDLFMLGQQVFYLLAIAAVLVLENLSTSEAFKGISEKKWWQYRTFFLHFSLGSILNIYSFFFLKSASIFNSIMFFVFLIAVIVGNELPKVQKAGVNFKWALWVLCLFCFFSICFPLLLGFVGWSPFLLSIAASAACIYGLFRLMAKFQSNKSVLINQFLKPSSGVLAIFFAFYIIGFIPPVPIAASDMGIYHALEKKDGIYNLSHQKPWWKFWHRGDQDFSYRAGDSVYFFTKVFSPARISDQVNVHWLYKDEKQGWLSSDKIPMNVAGGRKQGYRGYAVKKNISEGPWRVQVETTDGREIGRIYFSVKADTASDERSWTVDQF